MTPRHYKIVAHRGASEYEPENTLRAFRRAMALGADMSELDVHLSRDGHMIVMHNASVDATTGGQGMLAEMTLDEIKRLDAGQGERVPTLDEVLDLVGDRHGLYVELKGQGTPAALANLLRTRRAPLPPIIAGSFQADLVRQAAEHLGGLAPVSLLVGGVVRPCAELVALARSADASMIHLCWRHHPQPHSLLTPDLLAGLRAAGLGIVLWNEERPEVLAVLCTLDVDAICTNAPDLLAQTSQRTEM